MLDVVEEKLDGLVLKGAPDADTLEASLDAYTKPNLLKVAELNDFDVKQSWNKGQIIEVISEGLRGSLDERLSDFKKDQLAVLQGIVDGQTDQAEKNSEVVSSAVDQGLLYVAANEDEVVYTMPAEFEEKLDEMVSEDEPVEEAEEEAVEETTAKTVKPAVRTSPFASRRQRKQPVKQRIVGEKVGRNDPCPCGSGKKYKKCCWSKDQKANVAG